MCMAIPSQIVSIEGDVATVECFGQRREVNLMLMEEPVAPGDYVTVMRNAFAVEKIPAETAREALTFFSSALDDQAPR